MPQEPNEPKPQSQTSETPEGFQAPVSQTGEGQTQFSQQHPTGFQDASGYQVSNYQSYQAVSGAPYAPTDSVDYQPTSNYQASSGAPYTPSGYDINGWQRLLDILRKHHIKHRQDLFRQSLNRMDGLSALWWLLRFV